LIRRLSVPAYAGTAVDPMAEQNRRPRIDKTSAPSVRAVIHC
jgi:hypothetical protein